MLELATISVIEARKVAAKSIAQRINASLRLQAYGDFSDVRLESENAEFWTFVSGSQAWFNDGGAPAALFVSVSKADAHILTRDEVEDFYKKVFTFA